MTPDDNDLGYAWPNIASEQMASLFAKSAAFVRATPWGSMPESRGPVGVALPSLGLPAAVVSVMGELAQTFGFLVFKNIDGYDAFLDAMELVQAGNDPPFPWHLALTLEPGPEVVAELRREVAQRGWEVEAKQYPWVVAVEGTEGVTPDANQLRVVEAVLAVLTTHGSSASCTSRVRPPSVVDYRVETHAGPVDVTLADPHDAREIQRALEAPFDIELTIDEDEHEDLNALDRRLDAYSEHLMARFDASPERATLPPRTLSAVRFLIDVTFDLCDGGVTKLHPAAFRTFLFEMMPQYAVVEPVETAGIVKELRAFLGYLKREFNLHNAEQCLAVLDHRIVPNLRKALSDRSQWSVEKREALGAMPSSSSRRR